MPACVRLPPARAGTQPAPGRPCAGFGGRLFNQIRSREGLAYSVSGGWSATPIDHPGLFIATAETAQPAALLAALRGALEEAVVAPPPAQELQRAKQVGRGALEVQSGQRGQASQGPGRLPPSSAPACPLDSPPLLPPPLALTGTQESLESFVFNFSSRPAQLYRALTFDLLGIPQDYLFRWAAECVRLFAFFCRSKTGPSAQCRSTARHRHECPRCASPAIQPKKFSLPCRYKTGIERVTAADVQAAAQRRLHPSRQTVVVAGDAARLRPELEKLGLPIEDLPLS